MKNVCLRMKEVVKPNVIAISLIKVMMSYAESRGCVLNSLLRLSLFAFPMLSLCNRHLKLDPKKSMLMMYFEVLENCLSNHSNGYCLLLNFVGIPTLTGCGSNINTKFTNVLGKNHRNQSVSTFLSLIVGFQAKCLISQMIGIIGG